ncbi:hypothetical protein XFF6166_10265 [Xanthomonas citri pv. fuscans]|nr:hypothetical protein XFF6166_10265 [Xanthomonas citri pv. fuscans]SON94356.1 hypothetical protein XFF6990_140293 [Xanthomonas citri pv. fuscans]SOO02126.1 hypothetical protein XFF6960_580043 [Xanthomonas citri pv. fuscans]SOO06857.1 hypothetical protein XFF7767_80267 [Xanthomonas citri pv. fuscans]SOO07772.1 hypothetical protein XFF6970_1020044 [Xanthomonas citri pv. fuscans]
MTRRPCAAMHTAVVVLAGALNFRSDVGNRVKVRCVLPLPIHTRDAINSLVSKLSVFAGLAGASCRRARITCWSGAIGNGRSMSQVRNALQSQLFCQYL